MSIENINIIDAVGIDNDNQLLVMHILDNLEWNKQGHLNVLQEKLNNYLNSVIDGELFEKYPQCINYRIEIRIIAKFDMDKNAKDFFLKAFSFLSDYKINLAFEILMDN